MHVLADQNALWLDKDFGSRNDTLEAYRKIIKVQFLLSSCCESSCLYRYRDMLQNSCYSRDYWYFKSCEILNIINTGKSNDLS
jgi:hypothetical protein